MAYRFSIKVCILILPENIWYTCVTPTANILNGVQCLGLPNISELFYVLPWQYIEMFLPIDTYILGAIIKYTLKLPILQNISKSVLLLPCFKVVQKSIFSYVYLMKSLEVFFYHQDLKRLYLKQMSSLTYVIFPYVFVNNSCQFTCMPNFRKSVLLSIVAANFIKTQTWNEQVEF